MEILVDVLIGVSLLAVLGSLVLGLLVMARGGAEAGLRGNRFMRWRIWTQTAAVGVLVLSLLYKASH